MSWGYFAELDLRLPTPALVVLREQRPDDVNLPPGWSGLADVRLEQTFGRRITKAETFGEVLGWFQGESAKLLEERHGDETRLRVITLLDESLLDHAYPLATLFFAATPHGARGTLRLVDDGTSGGEPGVELTLTAGAITRRPLDAEDDLAGELGAELFATASPTPAKERGMIDPFTGLPIPPKKGT